MARKKAVLMILDGWGKGAGDKTDGIFLAKTPFIDSLYKHPNGQLITFGERVGLPEGQMGNSEVGHINIGAGRIVYQDLLRIDNAIADGSFYKNEILVGAFSKAKEKNKKVHLLGLVSTGGVHSSINHLYALCDMAKSVEMDDVFIHAFTDGRDCNPNTGLGHLEELEKHLKTSTGKVASVIGRYYAMDRDKRWERIKKGYDLLVHGTGSQHQSAVEAIEASYANDITDEFIEPAVIVDESGEPIATIESGDTVICFNFRTDRCREITIALTQENFEEFRMSTIPLEYYTMTNYDSTYRDINVVFDKENLKNTLGEVVANAGKKQIRIAETEKYPHVTFFFSGGRENTFEGETRIMVNSPKVATYDLKPEMSAYEVTEKICAALQTDEPDFVCLNFANPDMVGHTGVPEAIIKACETVDNCTEKIVKTGQDLGYSFVIIADHGNADMMFNPDGSPHTAHTKNMVPVFIIDDNVEAVDDGILADVAPTILDLLDMEQPDEMTGQSLVKNKISS